jgi:chorismate mutase/prephenate dehydratase
MSSSDERKTTDVLKDTVFLPEGSTFPEKAVIACQGISGAYSQIAAKRLFPGGTFIYFKNFGAVISAVKEGMCQFGVLPIENNTYGSVKDVYRLLGKNKEDAHIVRGLWLKIDHQLIGVKGASLKGIRKIYSHEQAIGQCESFLKSLGQKTEAIPVKNTAAAARMVAEKDDLSCVAISSPECAELYQLSVLKKNVSDTEHNYTRFLLIAKDSAIYPGADRISMILSLPHKPGALKDVLSLFSERNMNLLKIESEPLPGKDFEFRFYLDVEASAADPEVRELLNRLNRECPDFTFLGNYKEEM